MTPETHTEATSDTPTRASLPSTSRRRLFKGLAGGTGVLLSVQAKTALGAGACRSPSAMMSGNTSPRPNSGVTCSGGRSPGFWKVPQKFNYWPPGMVPATFNFPVSVCATGMQGLTLANVATKGTILSSKFPGAPSDRGFWEVLAFPNECGGQLLRHLAAAYLNSLAFTTPGAQYPLTTAQVVEMWTDLNTNGVYCPGSMVAGCGTTGWNQQTVISYISNMYDINSDLGPDPDLCQN